MKFTILFLCIIVGGCSSATENEAINRDLYLSIGEFKNGALSIDLVNGTGSKKYYEHWFGQKGNPVAYCENEKSEIYVCSKEVFLLENEFYTHETVILPGETETFMVNITGARKVGVKVYQVGESNTENYIWVNLRNGT